MKRRGGYNRTSTPALRRLPRPGVAGVDQGAGVDEGAGVYEAAGVP